RPARGSGSRTAPAPARGGSTSPRGPVYARSLVGRPAVISQPRKRRSRGMMRAPVSGDVLRLTPAPLTGRGGDVDACDDSPSDDAAGRDVGGDAAAGRLRPGRPDAGAGP